MRHLLVVEDLTPQEIEGVFAISQDLETKYTAGARDALFPGRVLALVFEKQSLRTRGRRRHRPQGHKQKLWYRSFLPEKFLRTK